MVAPLTVQVAPLTVQVAATGMSLATTPALSRPDLAGLDARRPRSTSPSSSGRLKLYRRALGDAGAASYIRMATRALHPNGHHADLLIGPAEAPQGHPPARNKTRPPNQRALLMNVCFRMIEGRLNLSLASAKGLPRVHIGRLGR